MSDAHLIAQAQRFRTELAISDDEFKLSNGWLHNFKQRHGIKQYTMHGESGSVDTTMLAKDRQELAALIEQYEPQYVYNMDETGLFYRMQPSKSLATKEILGKKKDKERVTVALCCNLDGSDKIYLVVIGRSKNPRCFKGVNIAALRFKYYSNESAWMTSNVFCDWLKYFNLKMCDRNVLLLIDNAPTHKTLELSNVREEFLPPNTTSMLQPLDAGIIQSFKLNYKRLFLQWFIDQLECGKNQD